MAWLLTIALARMLGQAGFGQYVAITAIVQLISVIADAGLNRVLIRDVAVDRDLAQSYVHTVRRARLALSLAAVAVAAAIASFGGDFGGAALVFGALALIPMADARTSEGLQYAFGHIQRAAFLAGLYAIARVAFSIAAAFLGFGVAGVLAAQSCATLVYAASMRYGTSLPAAHDGAPHLPMRSLFAASYPFAMLAALEALYARLDVLIVALITASPLQVGLYGAAYKLYEAATIPPASYGAVLVPTYARRLASRDPGLRRAVARGVTVSLVAGVAFAIVVAPNAQPILRLVYGPGYEDASGALAALAVAAIGGFVVYPISALLAASHQQRSILVRSIGQIAFNGVANVMLVARFGIAGAGLAMLLTTAWGALVYGALARRILAPGHE
jgi:O-antigen/teichoic acid export membrane protein